MASGFLSAEALAKAVSRTRVWRVRKDHTWIDAQVSTGPAAVEVQFFIDGERVLTRAFPTRALATAEADRRLRDLQRAGWTTHW